jgi:hypothetical protein
MYSICHSLHIINLLSTSHDDQLSLLHYASRTSIAIMKITTSTELVTKFNDIWAASTLRNRNEYHSKSKGRDIGINKKIRLENVI